jgi:hypothetical protein
MPLAASKLVLGLSCLANPWPFPLRLNAGPDVVRRGVVVDRCVGAPVESACSSAWVLATRGKREVN